MSPLPVLYWNLNWLILYLSTLSVQNLTTIYQESEHLPQSQQCGWYFRARVLLFRFWLIDTILCTGERHLHFVQLATVMCAANQTCRVESGQPRGCCGGRSIHSFFGALFIGRINKIFLVHYRSAVSHHRRLLHSKRTQYLPWDPIEKPSVVRRGTYIQQPHPTPPGHLALVLP